MPNRLERLQSYKRQEGPKGAGRDLRNLAYWSERAHINSDSHEPRAMSGEVRLTDTVGRGVPDDARAVKSRSTPNKNTKPYYRNEGPKMREKGKADPNHLDEQDYMPGVRRTTS
jgi:hypothetical protein